MRFGLQFMGAIGAAALTVVAAAVYTYSGSFGFNVILRRGMTTLTPVSLDDSRLTRAMRLALLAEPPEVTAGPMVWRQLRPGLQVGELPVVASVGEVDRILLARVSPREFRFEVHSAPTGDFDLDAWIARTGAAVIVNGSYYSPRGEPVTPVVARGRALGPREYRARHGAFVANGEVAGLQDLAVQPWQGALSSSTNALVSYPLLVDAEGRTRTQAADRRWLATRSFVAQDRDGAIVIGTTRDGFFSLDRLAAFLRDSPLGLRLALNLDGGPLACQAVVAAGFERRFCGDWETQVRGGELHLLGRLMGDRPWGLPLILAAYPKDDR